MKRLPLAFRSFYFLLSPCLLACAATASARQAPSILPPTQPAPALPAAPAAGPQQQAYAAIVMGAFCAVGASTSPLATKPAVGCGAGLNLLLYLPLFAEFGVMAPQASRSNVSGYMSFDAKVPLRSVNARYLPVAIVGYSRFFETGHAFDYGLALAVPRHVAGHTEPRSLQIELRDYWTFSNPAQHNVMLRVGWLIGVTD